MSMKKIVIIGSSGAGKSTFAHRLGEILRVEAFHLDRLFWRTGWKRTFRKKWRKIQQQLVQKDTWIIDGSYHDTLNIRLNAAEIVIFLDMPTILCVWRVIKRHFIECSRPDLPRLCQDRLDPTYLMKVWRFPRYDRKRLIKQVQGTRKEIVWLRSRKEVSRFLQEVR
jgi:adenylate kinase family enzyme